MLWMFRRVMFGPVDHAENQKLIDLGLREKFVIVAILVPIFWIGIYPETFLSRIRPSVIDLVGHVERARAVGEVVREIPRLELSSAVAAERP